MRVHSLDSCHIAEESFSRVTHCFNQQPGNGLIVERIDVRYGLASHLAAILQFP